jgi:hypothetical protein
VSSTTLRLRSIQFSVVSSSCDDTMSYSKITRARSQRSVNLFSHDGSVFKVFVDDGVFGRDGTNAR